MCDDVQLCNRCVREFLILARTWSAFGLPSKIRCDTAAARPLREHRHRLPARLGSVVVARSWWSAAVGRLPRGDTAAGPQDHRRSHALENRRRR